MLKTLPSDVFNVAVTSPPYFWVRDYGYEGQLGHEKSVDEYIEGLMEVFEEVKRTLHPEGVFSSTSGILTTLEMVSRMAVTQNVLPETFCGRRSGPLM